MNEKYRPAVPDQGRTADQITNIQNKDSKTQPIVKIRTDGSVPTSLSHQHHNPTSDIPEKVRGKYLYELKTPESWGRHLSGNICQCAACFEVFNSVAAFDKHRTGKADTRSCLSLAEMRKKDMAINHKGRWITQKFTEVSKFKSLPIDVDIRDQNQEYEGATA